MAIQTSKYDNHRIHLEKIPKFLILMLQPGSASTLILSNGLTFEF